jgi:hypothetical protein
MAALFMRKRAAVKLTLIALASSLTWSCRDVAVSPQPTPVPLAHYSDAILSFDYPASWMLRHYPYSFTTISSIVYLSTQPTHDPCVRTSSSISCNTLGVVNSLGPEDVLVFWGAYGFPTWNLSLERGSRLKVGGLAAKWHMQRPPEQPCMQIGGSESVTVWVASPVVGNAFLLEACLRSTTPAHIENELRALLASTRFANP